MKKKAESKTGDPKVKDILVNVVLDRSGSMETNRAGTISGYNEYLKGLRADKQANYSVTLIQFDAPLQAAELTVCYVDKPLAEVPDLDEKSYQPRGMTPLYDAIGECVRRVGDAKGRPVLCVIITDGLENASTEFSREAVKALIQEKEKDGWTFAFLGANIDSYSVGASIGVAAKNVANYAPGNEKAMFSALSCSTMNYASARIATGLRCQLSNESYFDDAQRASLMQRGAPSGSRSAQTGAPVTTGGSVPPSGGRGFHGKRRDWAEKLVS